MRLTFVLESGRTVSDIARHLRSRSHDVRKLGGQKKRARLGVFLRLVFRMKLRNRNYIGCGLRRRSGRPARRAWNWSWICAEKSSVAGEKRAWGHLPLAGESSRAGHAERKTFSVGFWGYLPPRERAGEVPN